MDTEEIHMMRGQDNNHLAKRSHDDDSLLRKGHFRYLPLSMKTKRSVSLDDLSDIGKTTTSIRKRQSLHLTEKSPRSSDPLDKRNIDGLITMGLHVDQQSLLLFSVIVNGDLDALKKLYTTQRLVSLDRQGNTPLHIAAQSGHIPVLK